MIIFWFVLIPLLVAAAAYAYHTWRQVRGLTGLALVILSVALLTNAMAAAQQDSCREYVDAGVLLVSSCSTYVPLHWLYWIRRVSYVVQMLSVLMLVDAYAALFNNHRAITTVAYEWFIRVSKERYPRRNNRNEVKA